MACATTKEFTAAMQMTPTAVREAFRIAQEERPGPVLLELPEDIASEECPRGRNGSIDEESR
ncbi:hypothetical protein BA011_26655 (plasmid) [Rhizobium leguminosarum]|uniref:Uncharacterized protein n=1 Tax=Rhizobium leguminosarum TaxID=384 RepID=A0A1B1CHU7_RHILE|nr:hypothetical protein BA011_26655 [Rhizobium leguminosarum]